MLRPFFNFYGGKWRAAPHYPAPRYARVVEPFAGAAGYSTRHHDRDIVLDRIDPMTPLALERGVLFDELHRRLAIGAHEDAEKFRIQCHGSTMISPC